MKKIVMLAAFIFLSFFLLPFGLSYWNDLLSIEGKVVISDWSDEIDGTGVYEQNEQKEKGQEIATINDKDNALDVLGSDSSESNPGEETKDQETFNSNDVDLKNDEVDENGLNENEEEIEENTNLVNGNSE